MPSTLYRKYRPQTFKEFIGQNHVKITLQNEIESGQLAHAYLFAGPRGIGKTTTARLLAKAVNCLNRKENECEPCNHCQSCLEITENRSLDIIEIDAASHTGVDSVRENIISGSKFVPAKRKYKVFIIDEIHMLSISAFNALLKTLEEPPKHVLLILATTELHKLPQTIISRCQRFDFKKVNSSDIIKRLAFISEKEQREADKEVLEAIAVHADGSVRDAESLLGQVFSIADKRVTLEQAQLVIPVSDFSLVLEFIGYLQLGQVEQGIEFINQLYNNGADLETFLADIIEVLRKFLLIKAERKLNSYAVELTHEQEKIVVEIVNKLKIEELIYMINVFLETKQNFKNADILQLPFELAIIQISQSRPSVAGNKTLKKDKDENNNDNQPKSGNNKEKSQPKSNDIAKQAENQKPAIVTKKTINLNIESIKERWEEILIKIKEYNYSLFSFLRVNKPICLKGDIVQIGVCYKFHLERINERKNREVLEKVFEEMLGQKLKIECTIIERSNEDLEYVKEDKAIQGLIENFGGKIVE